MTTMPQRQGVLRPVRGLRRERRAVLLLTWGSLLPVVGPVAWVVGQVLLWSSHRWQLRHKLLGTLVWPLGYVPVIFLLTAPGQGCWSLNGGSEVCEGSALPGYVGIPLVGVLVGAPLVVSTVLMVVARNRREREVARARA